MEVFRCMIMLFDVMCVLGIIPEFGMIGKKGARGLGCGRQRTWPRGGVPCLVYYRCGIGWSFDTHVPKIESICGI